MSIAAHILLAKSAYVRRRMPSPNVLMRIPQLKPVPAITPIGFHNMMRPDPTKTITPGIQLNESPLMKEVKETYVAKQDINAKKQKETDIQASEAVKAVLDVEHGRIQSARESLKKERERVQDLKKKTDDAVAEGQASENPEHAAFSKSLSDIRDSVRKAAAFDFQNQELPNFREPHNFVGMTPQGQQRLDVLDTINTQRPPDWLAGMELPKPPQDANFMQNMLYSPMFRGMAGMLFPSGVSDEYKRNMTLSPNMRATSTSRPSVIDQLMLLQSGT